MPTSLFEHTCFILDSKIFLTNHELELKLISDADMHIFFEGTRDGVFYISKRYHKANNICLKSYDQKQELKHMSLDENNLYGKVISKFLPLIRFEWINPTSAIVQQVMS